MMERERVGFMCGFDSARLKGTGRLSHQVLMEIECSRNRSELRMTEDECGFDSAQPPSFDGD
jgi:hypothetical protein